MNGIDKNIISFEKYEETQKLTSLVLNYLKENPPTLGHGYSHFVKAARSAYQIAAINDKKYSEKAYITTFLHDLYRPAEGKSGQEKHEEITSEIAQNILMQTNYSDYGKEIAMAINEKDEQIMSGKASLLTKILSLADKSQMSFQRAVAYTWASNQFTKDSGITAYSSFLETIRDFSLYQVKAWKVFLVIDLKGTDKAIEAYIKTDKDIISAVEKELLGKISYYKESLRIAKDEAEEEYKYLKKTNLSKSDISLITKNYSKLL
jgi:hypothetical protein